MTLRTVREADTAAIAAIYNHYIAHSVATFEEVELSADAMRGRIDKVLAAGYPWLVAEDGGAVLGYAYASRWKERVAYRYSTEASVYLAPDCAGGGWGTRLYTELFRQLRELGVHAVIGGITLPNPASVALHEKMGMRKVAEFPEVGFKRGRWLDVGYWQLNFQQ